MPQAAPLRRLRKSPLGRYRYVRLRWRVVFAAIDLLGTLAMSALRRVQAILGRSANESSLEPRTILVIQLDHLGDAVISTVLFRTLRRHYPAASIEVLAAPWNREVFELIPEVDQVHVCGVNRFSRDRRLGWLAATVWWGLTLRRRKIDLGIDVRGEFPHALILWLCGARHRLGWSSGGGGFLLTHTPRYIARRPEVLSRWALLAEIGIRPEYDEQRRPFLEAPGLARSAVAKRLAPFAGARGPRVVVHVGAGTQAKRWPAEHWRTLIHWLLQSRQAVVVLVGNAAERIIAAPIRPPHDLRNERGRVVDLVGRLSVAELVAVLEQADLFVGGDSGPAHVAAAAGTPAVVLFSGTNRVRQWRPAGRDVRVLRHSTECSPCHRHECPLPSHPCMRGLPPQHVIDTVEQMLAELESPVSDYGTPR